MAARAAFSLSRATSFSLKPFSQPPPPPPALSRHLRPPLPAISTTTTTNNRRAPVSLSCLVSGVDGGGVSDEFVSATKSGFRQEFSVIAGMLKRIEPLDTSVIAQGVSESAKDSMKQTISSMLGILPSDQFSVSVRVSKGPLDRLIVSSIITGYTLWNAEYRILLMRNFDLSLYGSNLSEFSENDVDLMVEGDKDEGAGRESVRGRGGLETCTEELEKMNSHNLEGLSPGVLDYIQQLESELSTVKQELNLRKQEGSRMEHIKKSNDDLLQYLRSLEPDMVTELSRPSSPEVEEIIHQLAQNILGKFFEEDIGSDYEGDLALRSKENFQNAEKELCDIIGTPRDYLAKLLFWCMLLGHHLRSLENRLHLSCVVGLL